MFVIRVGRSEEEACRRQAACCLGGGRCERAALNQNADARAVKPTLAMAAMRSSTLTVSGW